MALRLILTRHAKSSWGDMTLSDIARPLNPRGRLSAAAIGDWLAARGHLPGEALISPAERTRETWELIAQHLPHAPEARVLPALYLAEPDELLTALCEASAPVVILIAHNPGMAYLAQALAESPPADSRFQRFPTAATAVMEFDIGDWSELRWRMGRVVDFTVPRDLLEAGTPA